MADLPPSLGPLLRFQQITGQSADLENHGIAYVRASMESGSILVLEPGELSAVTPRVEFGAETARGIEAYLAFHLVVVEDNLIPRIMTCSAVSTDVPNCHFDSVEPFQSFDRGISLAYPRFSTMSFASLWIPSSIRSSSQAEKLSRILFSPPPLA